MTISTTNKQTKANNLKAVDSFHQLLFSHSDFYEYPDICTLLEEESESKHETLDQSFESKSVRCLKASAHSFKQFTSRLLKSSFSLSMHLYTSDGRHA